MEYNEYFEDSRTENPDSPSNSKYTTATITQNAFKIPLDRPVTAFQKVIDKLSGFSIGGGPLTGEGAKSAEIKTEYDEEFGPCVVIAKKLNSHINKIRKQESYLQKLKYEFHKDLEGWGDLMVNSDSRAVIKEASSVFQTQVVSYQAIMAYDDEIGKALLIVADKEKAMKKLHDNRKKLKSQWRQTSSNFGDKSYNAQAVVEDIESNSANLQVSKHHYNKAINTKLKDAFARYSSGLRSVGVSYEAVGIKFDQRLKDFDQKPMKEFPLREVSLKPKYDILSENRDFNIGSRLDPGSQRMDPMKIKHCAKCSIDFGKPTTCKQDHERGKRYGIATRIEPEMEPEIEPRLYHSSEWE